MIIISQDIKISVIIQNHDADDMEELLESLNNQTLDKLEIICLADKDSNIKADDVIIKDFNDFKIDDIGGEYVIFADPSDKYYLVGLESLIDYSSDNDLELLLYSPINYDIRTKEIYEKSLDILREISGDIKKEIFSLSDLSRHLFSLEPEIKGILYKKSFLDNYLSDDSFASSLNDYYLFFKSILNSNRIGIFKNPVYIRSDCSRYELENSDLSNQHYYGVGEYSLEDINILNDDIEDLFKKSGHYEDYNDDLANFKMDLYKEFLSKNKLGNDYERVKDDLNLNYDVSDFNANNALFYKSIMDSASFDEALLDLKVNNSMGRIVDKIIKVDLDEIEKYDFPTDELFGLVVFIDSVPYCFTVRFASRNDNLICFGPGAQQRNVVNSKGELVTPPFFQRWSWHDQFDESVITYADPCFFYDADIRIGWFVGEKSQWYLENAALVIERLSVNRNIKPQEILFYGSSAGGFVSIALATLVKDSRALVNNSQFILMNYEEEHLDRLFNYLRMSYGELSRDEMVNLINYRINLIELFKREKYVPQISYYVNSDSSRDIHNQCIPFIEEISRLEFFDNDFDIHFYKDIYDIPHTPLGKDKIIPIIKSFSKQKEDDTSDEISELQNELDKQKQLNEDLLTSNSWKLLAPARRLKKVFRK